MINSSFICTHTHPAAAKCQITASSTKTLTLSLFYEYVQITVTFLRLCLQIHTKCVVQNERVRMRGSELRAREIPAHFERAVLATRSQYPLWVFESRMSSLASPDCGGRSTYTALFSCPHHLIFGGKNSAPIDQSSDKVSQSGL